MTEKKFTEEQYKKITDCFDEIKKYHSMGILNYKVIYRMNEELSGVVDFIHDWKEIAAIANPATREEAKEKYVEKEKKYYWKTKKIDDMGHHVYIEHSRGLITLSGYSEELNPEYDSFTKTEIINAGYNPDMFDREEVE